METIKLKYPILFEGRLVEQIELRRPKVKDRIASSRRPGTDVDKEIFLFSQLCGVAPEFFDEMDAADYATLQEKLGSFF